MSLLTLPARLGAWLAHPGAREAAGAAAVVVGVTLSVFVSLRSGGKASGERCDELLDRYVALRMRAVDEHATDAAIDARRERARAHADAACRERLGEVAAKCAQEAPSLDAFERCFP